jgi:predicted ATP-grasp superfamily ATP-dependent carboligase
LFCLGFKSTVLISLTDSISHLKNLQYVSLNIPNAKVSKTVFNLPSIKEVVIKCKSLDKKVTIDFESTSDLDYIAIELPSKAPLPFFDIKNVSQSKIRRLKLKADFKKFPNYIFCFYETLEMLKITVSQLNKFDSRFLKMKNLKILHIYTSKNNTIEKIEKEYKNKLPNCDVRIITNEIMTVNNY